MKKNIPAVCIIILLCAMGWASYGQRQNPSRARWEYMIRNERSLANSPVDMRALGEDGWELITVTIRNDPGSSSPSDILTTYYFKRQK